MKFDIYWIIIRMYNLQIISIRISYMLNKDNYQEFIDKSILNNFEFK